MLALSWLTALPTSYPHVVFVDEAPATIPFAVTQYPPCNSGMLFTLTSDIGADFSTWITSSNPTSYIEVNPSSLDLVGSHNFKLTASVINPDPAADIEAPLEIQLVHPCETASLFGATILNK